MSKKVYISIIDEIHGVYTNFSKKTKRIIAKVNKKSK